MPRTTTYYDAYPTYQSDCQLSPKDYKIRPLPTIHWIDHQNGSVEPLKIFIDIPEYLQGGDEKLPNALHKPLDLSLVIT